MGKEEPQQSVRFVSKTQPFLFLTKADFHEVRLFRTKESYLKRLFQNSIGCENAPVKWKFDAFNRYFKYTKVLDTFFNEHYGSLFLGLSGYF